MNSLRLTNGPATLNESDLRSQNGNCPCSESLCDCCTQIEARLKQIRDESSLLKQQLEALSINHEMRSAAVVATLLNWIDDDAARLKTKSCCCRTRELGQRSGHMAEGSFGPITHSTPMKNSLGFQVPELKRDAAACHVESVKFVTPSITPMDSSNAESSYFQGVSVGSSNVFLDSSNDYRSGTFSNGEPPVTSEQNDVSQMVRNHRNHLSTAPPNSRISQDGSFRLSDFDSSSASNTGSASLSNKTSSSIRTLDAQEEQLNTIKGNGLSGDARTSLIKSGNITKPEQARGKVYEQTQDKEVSGLPIITLQNQANQDSLLRSSSAPPEGPRPNLHPPTFHSQPLQTYRKTGLGLEATCSHSQKSAVPPSISEVPCNPASVCQPVPLKPDSQPYSLQQASCVVESPSNQFPAKFSQVKPEYSDTSIESTNQSSFSISRGQQSQAWQTGLTSSGNLTAHSSSGQDSIVGSSSKSGVSYGSINSKHFSSNSNNLDGDTDANCTKPAEKLISRRLFTECQNDGSEALLVGATENVQRSPSRSPHTVQADFSTNAELEGFVTKLISNRRLLGEIAFQLDRRILNYIFNSRRDKKRFYGYTIQNIPEKICRESEDQMTGQRDASKYALLFYRYEYLQNMLRPHGYNIKRHSETAEILVNCFGLLPTPSNKTLQHHFAPSNSKSVWAIVESICPPTVLADVGILFNSLLQFSKDDGKPMIMW